MPTIILDKFKLRSYQKPLWDAVENGYKRIIAILPRRAGKDLTVWNLMIIQALKRVGVYFYVFPTYSQGRKILFDSLTNDGVRFLDFLPKEAIEKINITQMKIIFKNKSLIQVVGSDNVDSLVGTNPCFCVFSEYALQDEKAYQFLRPALTAIDGTAIFVSTPRGHNSFYDLYKIALDNPKDWFLIKMTVEETKHIALEDIQTELKSGEMSEDLIQQEYYCSFDLGVEGSYYSKYINKMRLEGRIGDIPYDPYLKVHTAWDLGVHDSTEIIFFSVKNNNIYVFDHYTNRDKGLDHYAKVLQEKGYIYGTHFAPHDIKNREFSHGMSRLEVAARLGINFSVVPNLSIDDGIEATRSLLGSRMYIDSKNCANLLKALESYRREYDSKKKVYRDHPLHDWSSNACFSGNTLIKTPSGDVPIKDIKQGDLVITPLGIRKVLATHSRYTSSMYQIKTKNKELVVTSDHEIFSNKGLVYCDTLRYNDMVEYYSPLRSFLWKKLFGYFLGEQDSRGFKKIILSLKMSRKSSLMDIFLDGKETIIERQLQHSTKSQLFKEQYGYTIMEKYLKSMLSTIKMAIRKIMPLIILNALKEKTICECTQIDQIHGHNQKNAKDNCVHLMPRLQNGIEAKKEENGIENTQKNHCHRLEELNTISSVHFVESNSQENKHGKSFVLIPVNKKVGHDCKKIWSKGLVVFVRIYLFATNILSKKHVVKSVQQLQCSIPEKVYDLTIEQDGCYYANGYLASNSDALRMLSISIPQCTDESSPEELERRYQQVRYGVQQNLPRIFQ